MQGNNDSQPAIPMQCKLLAVLAGKARPMGPHGEPSGILKRPCTDSVFVQAYGLPGDEQGDRRYHGGVEKAVHHYAFDHYATWRADLPASAPLFEQPGLFGENFSSIGLTETNVHVGDMFQVGTSVLQVSQARQPCWKLNIRTSIPDMAVKVQTTGRTGWYYRVIQPGWVKNGDEFNLLQRPNPGWPLQKILYYLYAECLNRAALTEIAGLSFLAYSWRRLAQARLDFNAVEDWSKRLNIPRVS